MSEKTPPTAEQVSKAKDLVQSIRAVKNEYDFHDWWLSEEEAAQETLAALAPAERAGAVPDWQDRAAKSIAAMASEWYRGPARGDQDLPADLILSRLRRFAPTRAGALDAAGAKVPK